MNAKEELLTTNEVAKELGVAKRSIQLWTESGILKAWKTPGGHRRFKRADIEKMKSGIEDNFHADNSAQSSYKVFVVEDDESLLEMYKMQLDGIKEGLEIITADDGYEALYKIGSVNPDLIITDLQMPRMDGFHLVKILVKQNEVAAENIVVITGLDDGEIKKHGGLPDGVDVYKKPVELQAITNMILDRFNK